MLNIIRLRLGMLALVLIGVTLITFSISQVIPGDPARLIAGDKASDEVVANIREKMGLDKSIPVQYISYVSRLATGDFGTSLRTGRPVAQDLKIFFPATLELVICSLILATVIAVPLGVASAVYREGLIDHLARLLSLSGVSIPPFWVGLMGVILFYGRFDMLPGGGRIGTGLAPEQVTGFYLFDSLWAGDWAAFKSAGYHLILPVATLSFLNIGVVARQVRSSMLEVLSEDFIRTAKAFGLTRKQVIFNYALPNALIPSVTVLGLLLGDLLFGAVVTETVFAWPGMGKYVVESIGALDFPAIMGFTVVVAFAYVVINLLVDLTYLFLDPQIRMKG